MIEEVSAGIVVFRRELNKNYFLLLNYPSGHWDFIKGKVEESETYRQTAMREAREETGIENLKFINGFEEWIEYNFQYDNQLIHKKVIFFLAETDMAEIALSHEHLDFVWMDFEDAMQKITFDNARRVLTKAKEILAHAL